MVRVVGIIQARMAANGLPGQVLQTLSGRTVLDRMVHAAHDSGALDELLVLTGADEADDAIVDECHRLGIAAHRNPDGDLLRGHLDALAAYPADAVVPLDADCPLLDPELIALAARVFRTVPNLDYVSTAFTQTLPIGLDVEVVAADTLARVDALALDGERASVTAYVAAHLDQFRVMGLTLPPDRSHLRLAIDSMEDWALISMVVSHFGDSAVPVDKLVEWLDANPAVRALNSRLPARAA
ncbi:hypothetical protein GCM10010123_27990 [Pilimelia anulata]|uniref:Spore coat polysaccharide biosynthesis protein SpsF n=1 Tax=Pilimelia anulata TaxID=53371 RepID=A0A8J3FAA9_9ACTN|nr:NTP transferase domain-containing protein [Pilimelia anulata]GGJ96402.1 hypothetical protein GCM10010123_27990 [Pilimelia anulata]